MDRRDFLKSVLVAGIALPGDFGQGQFRRRDVRRTVDPSQIPAYAFRTIPVGRFPDLRREFEVMRREGGLSPNKTFLNDIAPLDISLPADFPGAKSVVVIAAFSKTMVANFKLDGRTHGVFVPPQYYRDGLNAQTLPAVVRNDILKAPGARVTDVTERVPLKLLAARSGLGRYGRNNLIFVDGMGSYNLLWAFLTDVPAAQDTWSELDVLDACRHCSHCDRACPTDCIPRGSFVIDAGRCITLYNENDGKFPNFILPSMHHALMGCLKCQTRCPENGGLAELSGNLEDVTEEETAKILEGMPDDALLASLRRKLPGFPALNATGFFPVLTRNLKVLVRA